jgi:3-hydroxybutyryl-CoA dehydratase
MNSKDIDEIKIGDHESFSKTITETDVYMFAGITGDMNPIHVNRSYAATTKFAQPIAHGILSLGLISKVLGTQLPGPGAIYLRQTITFTKPVFIGDTVTASVEVIDKDMEKRRLRLRTWCQNQEGDLLMEGEASLIIPS